MTLTGNCLADDSFFRFTIGLHRDSADYCGNDVPFQISVRFDDGKVRKLVVLKEFNNYV